MNPGPATIESDFTAGVAVRVAVVTGGARGIGACVARRLARDGMRVAIADLNERDCATVVESITAAGGDAIGVGLDVTNAVVATEVVGYIADRLGPPSVLVNNAGITRDNLLHKMSEEDWSSVVSVHLNGAFNMTRAVQPHMISAKWGRIINMSSTSALGNKGQANYSAAKAGIQGFTKTIAIELAKFGITSNAVAPGFVETEMTHAAAERLGMTFDEFQAEVASRIPVGRIGQPDDVAAAVAFFARDDASFVNGQVLYVAGGPRV